MDSFWTDDKNRGHSLLAPGYFDVRFSPQYGEKNHAFPQPQENIISAVSDLSVFAWRRHRSLTGDVDGSPMRQYFGVVGAKPRDLAYLDTLPRKSNLRDMRSCL